MALYKIANQKLFEVVYFLCALIEILLLSGITYGWASMTIVFKQKGFFEELCTDKLVQGLGNNTLEKVNGSLDAPAEKNGNCSLQSKRFNLIFNVAVVFLCCAKLPIGIFIDRYGPRSGQILGCALYVTGGLALAFVTKESANILFLVFIFFSIGGGFIAVAKYQVTRIIYTRIRSLVLSVLHGTFDSSAIVLVFFKLAWENGISLRDISLFYTGLSFVIVTASTIFLTSPYSDLLGEAFRKEPSRFTRRKSKESSVDSGDDKDIIPACLMPETLWSSIFSPLYLLELGFLCIIQLRLWFFIGSLDELIAMLFPSDKASVDDHITYFGYAQFCGIIVGPIIGYVFDRDVIKCNAPHEEDKNRLLDSRAKAVLEKLKEGILPFFLTNAFCVVFSVLAMSKWKPGLIISFILHVVTRGFLYASHASFIGMAFRPEKFGTLYGLGIFAAGLFGLLEYPLYTIVHVLLGTDPFWMNGSLLILVLITNVFPFYLMYHCKMMKKRLSSQLIGN